MIVYECVMIGYIYFLCGISLQFSGNLEFMNITDISIEVSKMCILPKADLADQCLPGIIQYNRCSLYNIRQLSPAKLDPCVLQTLKQLDILQQYRGTRGGRGNERRIWDKNDGVHLYNIRTLPQNVSTRITNIEHRQNPITNSVNHDNDHI